MDYNEKVAQAYSSEDDYVISKKDLHSALSKTMCDHLNEDEIKDLLYMILSNLKKEL